MCTSYLTSTCNSVNHSQTATMVCITKKISLAYFCYSCRQATVYAAGILYSFLLMMLSVYVTTQRMIILQQATDYYSFNICCIESLQCISCVIKFNSKRKLSNYIYRTTPLFLSTHQKISTKNDLWVSCTCTPGKGPVGTLFGLVPHFTAHRNQNIYYYSGWSEQWQPTVRQIHCIISANKVTPLFWLHRKL